MFRHPGPAAKQPVSGRAFTRDARRRASQVLASSTLAILATFNTLAALAPGSASAQPQTFQTEKGSVQIRSIARGLEHPWGLAFLPDGHFLVTERPGRLRRVSPEGALSAPIAGLPKMHAAGQAGLLDVVLSPDFASNRTIFLSFAEPSARGARTAVARAVLDGDSLTDLRIIFRQTPDAPGNHHWGSRLVFDRQGNLFITLGDRYGLRDEAQNLANHLGKVVRIKPDGSIPADNPFVRRAGAQPELWSYGHRNVQGAALHPVTGALWTHEHGPQGGDEVNRTVAGGNHGWPVITHGREYVTGLRIGEGNEKPGVVAPSKVWIPSIAPSGMAFYSGNRFSAWQGNLLVGALRGQALVRLELDGDAIVHEERLLQGLRERIRDVRQGPNGLVYLLTDSPNGQLLELAPHTP